MKFFSIPNSSLYLLFVFVFISLAQPPVLFSGWKDKREGLDHVYQVGNFRIFYTLDGKEAVQDTTDTNNNRIPDIVEDIAVQLEVADTLYSEIFGYIEPVASERYRDQIKTIDVHIISSKSKGDSGDGVIAYKYRDLDIPSFGALSITLSNKIKSGNLTPAHELTHAYMNGYTMFKNRWLTEGVARWLEHAFKDGTGRQEKLPDNTHDFERLLQRTYDAKYFWNRLAFLCSDDSATFNLPEKLQKQAYLHKGKRVVKGNDLYGYEFIRNLLHNLSLLDDAAAIQRGFEKFHWKESEQKSPQNNRYILMALHDTISAAQCRNLQEVKDFLQLTDLFVDNRLVNYDAQAQDVTSHLEVIGNPYEGVYKDGEESYARNIWDMKVYREKLFLGAGNSNNKGPAPNAGPVPIVSYDPATGTFSQESKIDDEQINVFSVLNDRLYVPGADAVESHRYGNFYVRQKKGTWIKKRNIPRALHNFAMTFFNGELFAGISTPEGAAVARSADKGESWKVQQIGPRQRTYSMLSIGNKLYAMKQFLAPGKLGKQSREFQDQYYGVAEYAGGGKFVPRYDLTEKDIFPDTVLRKKYKKRITRSLQLGAKAFYIGAYNFKLPFGFYVASSLQKNKIAVERIKLPLSYTPRDFLVRGNTIYLLCTEKVKKKYIHKVITTSLDNPDTYNVLFQFSLSTFARSFEEMNGDFYFGLGSEIRSTKKWSIDEISPDTGKIIKVSKKHT